MAEKVPLYDDFSQSYDVMVSWEGRLAREEPYFRSVFGSNDARSVLDVGCATGGHVLHFARMGLRAVGADPSAEMVRLARERAGDQEGVRFVRAGFDELRHRVGERFDVVTCLGNTLPHVLTLDGLERALVDIAAVLTSGGILAIQQLNYDRILAERQRFLGVSSGTRDGVEQLFFRFYDFQEESLVFNMVTLKKEEGQWGFTVGSTPLRPITQGELGDALNRAGFVEPHWFGSYSEEPFDPVSSNDLVVVARRL